MVWKVSITMMLTYHTYLTLPYLTLPYLTGAKSDLMVQARSAKILEILRDSETPRFRDSDTPRFRDPENPSRRPVTGDRQSAAGGLRSAIGDRRSAIVACCSWSVARALVRARVRACDLCSSLVARCSLFGPARSTLEEVGGSLESQRTLLALLNRK